MAWIEHVEEATALELDAPSEEMANENRSEGETSPGRDMRAPHVSTLRSANEISVKKFGLTQEQMRRARALIRLGVTEEDLRVAHRLLAITAEASAPRQSTKKEERLLGYTHEQMSFLKALEVLGISERHLEEERMQQLASLGLHNTPRDSRGEDFAASTSCLPDGSREVAVAATMPGRGGRSGSSSRQGPPGMGRQGSASLSPPRLAGLGGSGSFSGIGGSVSRLRRMGSGATSPREAELQAVIDGQRSRIGELEGEVRSLRAALAAIAAANAAAGGSPPPPVLSTRCSAPNNGFAADAVADVPALPPRRVIAGA